MLLAYNYPHIELSITDLKTICSIIQHTIVYYMMKFNTVPHPHNE